MLQWPHKAIGWPFAALLECLASTGETRRLIIVLMNELQNYSIRACRYMMRGDSVGVRFWLAQLELEPDRMWRKFFHRKDAGWADFGAILSDPLPHLAAMRVRYGQVIEILLSHDNTGLADSMPRDEICVARAIICATPDIVKRAGAVKADQGWRKGYSSPNEY